MFGWVNTVLNKIIPDRLARQTRSEIMVKYGPPDSNYQIKYCKLWEIQNDYSWFPAKKIFINIEFKEKLFQAFKELEIADCHLEIKTFDGCFAIRNTRGSSLPSLHSWAMAMDLNASAEKLGQTFTHWSKNFVEIMTGHVYWGGDFFHRKDPMHFSLYGE